MKNSAAGAAPQPKKRRLQMSDFLNEDLEQRLMVVHFEFTMPSDDWIPDIEHCTISEMEDALRKANMVRESKDQLCKAIEEYFRVCHFSIYGQTFPANESPMLRLDYYNILAS